VALICFKAILYLHLN